MQCEHVSLEVAAVVACVGAPRHSARVVIDALVGLHMRRKRALGAECTITLGAREGSLVQVHSSEVQLARRKPFKDRATLRTLSGGWKSDR